MQTISQIFWHTQQLIGPKGPEILRNFEEAFGDEDLSDQVLRLPAFLKTRGVRLALLEVSQWECLHWQCKNLEWGQTKLDRDQIGFVPGVQFQVITDPEAAEALEVRFGLHAIFARENKAVHRAIEKAEALLLDALREERKFTRAQVIEFMKAQDVTQNWSTLLEGLFQDHLLTVG